MTAGRACLSRLFTLLLLIAAVWFVLDAIYRYP